MAHNKHLLALPIFENKTLTEIDALNVLLKGWSTFHMLRKGARTLVHFLYFPELINCFGRNDYNWFDRDFANRFFGRDG